jgi:hypothetical protein
MRPHTAGAEDVAMRTRLLIGALAATATLVPATAQASSSLHAYNVALKGEQTSEWTYTGNQNDACATPEDGKGRTQFVFRSKRPVKAYAGRAGAKGAWSFAASTDLKAEGSRSGEWNRWNSRTSGRLCGGADEHKPATGCGRQTWTIPAAINYGLSKATKTRMDVWGMYGRLAGDRQVFEDCPWFFGPSDSSYWDDTPKDADAGQPSADMLAGLRYAFNHVSPKAWRTGKSFDVSKRFTKEYRSDDANGRLQGYTTVRWTVHLKKAKG